jgi:hypothetical protein
VTKVIPYHTLARQQQLNYLKHQDREYRQREKYLANLGKLLFRTEAQLRQLELQQLEVFREMAAYFKIPLAFPDLGDRVGLQQLFTTNPFLQTLQEFFAGRLSADECHQRITNLQTE